MGIGVEFGGVILSEWFFTFSANSSYHFRKPRSSQKWTPFFTGGYSMGIREGALHGVNFGGGAQYRMRERLGLRLEFRDQMYLHRDARFHLWQFRIGVAFLR
jgi:hypothetical protein